MIRACTVCERRCGARGAQCRSAHSRVPPAAQDRWGACGERTALPCVSYGRKVSHSVSGARATRLQARVQHVPTSSQRPPRIVTVPFKTVSRGHACQPGISSSHPPARNPARWCRSAIHPPHRACTSQIHRRTVRRRRPPTIPATRRSLRLDWRCVRRPRDPPSRYRHWHFRRPLPWRHVRGGAACPPRADVSTAPHARRRACTR